MTLVRALAVLGLALPAFAQYAGPAILSRGEAPTATVAPQISFRPFIELAGVYDSGLAAVSTDAQGTLANAAAEGIEITGGVSGAHSWRHTRVGVQYQGSFRHYNRKTYYDGADQSLLFGVTHQFSRHTSLALRESAGLYSRAFGLLGVSQAAAYDASQSNIPTTDFFDNRTVYFSSQADFTWQKSARLSFNIGGDGSLVRRRSSALYGVTLGAARCDAQYRITRRSTIGANYTYTQFAYRGLFSGTDMHNVAAAYAIRLTRQLEFSANAGGMRLETKSIQSVPIDPVIAALLGITSGLQTVYKIKYLPTVNARLAYSLQRGLVYISGSHIANPGNGLFLTSTVTSAAAGYTYTGLRRWSLGLSAGYSRANSLGNITGEYGSVAGGFNASRQITRSVHAVANYSARHYDSSTYNGYNRIIHEARIGLAFAPGDVPLRVW